MHRTESYNRLALGIAAALVLVFAAIVLVSWGMVNALRAMDEPRRGCAAVVR